MSQDINNDEEVNLNSNEVMADLPLEEQDAFLEEVGTLIFKSTVMRYLTMLNPEESLQFETFIKVHVDKDDFIEKISEEYPQFKILLDEEMEAFNNQL